MSLWMLDTNTVSFLLRGQEPTRHHVSSSAVGELAVSAVTVGELRYGLAKRPEARRLHEAVNALLQRMDVLSWNRVTAEVYGHVRAQIENAGRSLAPLDMMIAAHAAATGRILVTNDKAFVAAEIDGLAIEDWSI